MFKAFVDWVFPPLCLACRERCSTKHFCPECWKLCEPPDPALHCRHCFVELEQKRSMCPQCTREPVLSAARAFVFDKKAPIQRIAEDYPEAIAGFAVNQWIRLEWPMPDAVILMPDRESKEVGKIFSKLLERPGKKLRNRFKEEQQFLLFDASNSVENLQKAVSSLSESFPKRIFVLTLFQNEFLC